MDSGNNSSSLQSSSGGDEEFDSRTFFATNINASATNNANSNDFSLTNTNTVTTTTTTNSNNSLPNFIDNFSFLVPASSSSSSFPLLDLPDDPAPARTVPTPANRPSTTLSSPRSTTSSRKRSRASRRAPTTVLTTDTSNFRAMVQEFTGIPAPPFSSSSSPSPYPPPPRSRFDYFHPAFINAGSGGAGAGASPSPSFLLKPYPHRPFHFPNTNATTSAANISSVSGASSINYHHLPHQPPSSSNFGLTNSQSLLQSQQLTVKLQMMPSASTAAADYDSVVGDLGQLTGVIGSGWGQDTCVDPTSLLRQVSNGAAE